MTRKRPEAVADPQPPPLNPHFQSMLPEMIEDLSQVVIGITGQLDTASVRTGQFLDHLQFEIDKVRLALDRLQWEPKVDTVDKARLEAWLAKLTAIHADIEGKDVKASLTFVEGLLEHMSEDLVPT